MLEGEKNQQDAVLTRAQSLVIEHVVHDRPLAKMQEKLDHEDESERHEVASLDIVKSDEFRPSVNCAGRRGAAGDRRNGGFAAGTAGLQRE